MKCLVTGGAGFIGSHLVDRLIKDGHTVVSVDDLSTGKEENENPKAHNARRKIETRNYCRIGGGFDNNNRHHRSIFKGVDVVFHLAAKARVQPSIKDPISFNQTNVDGTLNILKACVDNNVKRVVFSSSSSVYGNAEKTPTTEVCSLNPLSPYALQKVIGEQYCKLFSDVYELDTVCLRYFNVYGDRMSLDGAYRLVIPIFAQQKLDGESMTINGDGEQRRDFTHIDDVVEANVITGFSKLKFTGDAFNIGNGDNRSVNEIADMIGGDRVHGEPVIEPKETLADISKAKFILNWKPNNKIEDWIKTYKKELGI